MDGVTRDAAEHQRYRMQADRYRRLASRVAAGDARTELLRLAGLLDDLARALEAR